MRFFIALEIPPYSRDQITNLQKKIQSVIPEIKLTYPDKLHLTIAFIGEQPASLQSKLAEVIATSAQGIKPFKVTPAYIDGFPNLHHAHVMWMGVKGDIDKLMVIRERIKDGLIKLGLEADERRYVPHITIGKLNHFLLRKDQEDQLQKIVTIQLDPINIASIKLFESVPNEGFHQHNTLAEIDLS